MPLGTPTAQEGKRVCPSWLSSMIWNLFLPRVIGRLSTRLHEACSVGGFVFWSAWAVHRILPLLECDFLGSANHQPAAVRVPAGVVSVLAGGHLPKMRTPPPQLFADARGETSVFLSKKIPSVLRCRPATYVVCHRQVSQRPVPVSCMLRSAGCVCSCSGCRNEQMKYFHLGY